MRKKLTTFSSILDVWQGFEYASGNELESIFVNGGSSEAKAY